MDSPGVIDVVKRLSVTSVNISMETYVSFLRGVNMTGHNSIKMADLKAMFVKIGLT